MILRGANDYMLDEMERALHDAICTVKRTLESNTVNFSTFRLYSSIPSLDNGIGISGGMILIRT